MRAILWSLKYSRQVCFLSFNKMSSNLSVFEERVIYKLLVGRML